MIRKKQLWRIGEALGWHKRKCVSMSSCCAICGNIEFLETHHIVPKSIGGTDHKNNMVILCDECHAKVHKNMLRGPDSHSLAWVPKFCNFLSGVDKNER